MNGFKLESPALVTPDEIENQVQEVIEEIKSNNQTHGRDDETLYAHNKSGVILEVGFAKMLGARLNRQAHDYLDPETFAWDLETDEYRFEVKPTRGKDTWFNFNINGATNPSGEQLSRANLTTFLKYTDKVDYLITGWFSEVPDGWLVYPKWIMKASDFKQFVRVSNPSAKGTTHFYHVKAAIRAGSCKLLS